MTTTDDASAGHVAAPGSRLAATASAAVQAAPHPGHVAAAQAATEQQRSRRGMVPVPVREQRAAHTTYRTVIVPQGGAVNPTRLLGRNDLRRSAIISCVAGTVVLAASFELAGEVNNQAPGAAPTANLPGAWLASGTPGAAIPLEGTAEVWGVATSTGIAAVAIVEEWWQD